MSVALMRALPPVGAGVPLLHTATAKAKGPDLTAQDAYVAHFVDSGTSALALALGFARQRRRNAPAAAIFPAYGCPDLVAAAEYAGIRPLLIDLSADTPWMSTESVARHISDISAVVAVNFLGMPDRLESLANITRGADVTLIEDSAQMAPFSGGSTPRGDLVVYSFGRGKPVSLLTGGALLVRQDWAEEFSRWVPALRDTGGTGRYLLKCATYNLATHPRLFVWARRLPFLRLGEVRYSKLLQIEGMLGAARRRLARAYSELPGRATIIQTAMDSAIASLSEKLISLPAALGAQNYPLLRYPILARDPDQRDSLVARLDAAGLGASSFYGRALAEIPGVPGVAGTDTPNAASFGCRLFTLPIHAGVRLRDVDAMVSIARS